MSTKNLGIEIIFELKKRGLLASYFNYKQYQELRDTNTIEEVKQFFRKNRFTKINITDNAREIVDNLETKYEPREKKLGKIIWWIMSTIGSP